MYSPTLMRFLQNDPIGFDAGDANTYRYEGNDPTRRLDPSGMDSQWTESSALQQLKGQIQEWREKKFNFAANLLQHFIDKKGPAQYVLSKADIAEVKEHAAQLVNFAASRALYDTFTIEKRKSDFASFQGSRALVVDATSE